MRDALFRWGEEVRHEGEADVLAVDFRQHGIIVAALIGVRKAFSLGQLVPQLIANAFNVRRAPDIERAVEWSGVPYAFVRREFVALTDAAVEARSGGTAAMVVTDDDRARPGHTNYEIARALSRVTQRPVVYVDAVENVVRTSMRQLGMPASLVEGLLQVAVL